MPAFELPETTRANITRVDDYLLGGKDHFAADRQLADRIAQAQPLVVAGVRANRAFVRRAVAYLAGQGIDQFVDLGSGLPTGDNVHQIAGRVNPHARTVYVDVDPSNSGCVHAARVSLEAIGWLARLPGQSGRARLPEWLCPVSSCETSRGMARVVAAACRRGPVPGGRWVRLDEAASRWCRRRPSLAVWARPEGGWPDWARGTSRPGSGQS